MSHKPTVIFIQVKDNTSKVKKVCDIIQKQFSQGNAIMITVPSLDAANYLDNLLWKTPEESFLPHTVSETPAKDKVVISTRQENLNKAEILFNLCPEAPSVYTSFTKIYELWDLTDSKKEALSQKRREQYKNLGFSCYLEE